MRTILGVIFGILTLAVVAIVALPYLISTEWIRDQVTEAVRESTGRDLVIAGETSLSVFPNFALVLSHASLSNPQGREGHVATMEALDIGLRLLPLIDGRVEVDRFIVTGPQISLEIDEAGKANWAFGVPSHDPADGDAIADILARSRQADAPVEAPPPPPADAIPAFESIELGEMRIVSGLVTFSDRRRGTVQEIRDIDATVELDSLDDPLSIDASASWQGEPLTIRLSLAEPRALATGTPSSAAAEIESAHLRASFSGTVTGAAGFAAEGEIAIATDSIKELVRWVGARPPKSEGLGKFSLNAAITAGKGEVTLSAVRLKLDGISAEGGGLVSLTGPRPLVQATLAADLIDLNRYLGGGGGGGGSAGGAPALSEPSPAAGGAPAGTAGRGGAQPGWSDDPIDVSGLQSLDADLRLSARELRVADISAGQSALAVTLRDAILTVDLSELQLYEGRAAGKVTVNGTGDLPAMAASFTIDNVSARQLLGQAARIDWLDGRGQFSGALSSRGHSERALVSALNGDVAARFTDGSIRGFNLAQMLRGLKDGAVFDWSREDAQQTDFSELSASFTVTNGIARTDNVQMLGPLVRLTGSGVANLPERTVDFRINPKLVASIEGQGGIAGLAGIEVPFVIRGSWDSPTITPDLAAVLQDPEKVVDTIEQIGRSLDELRNGGNVGETIEQITKREPKEFLNLLTGGGDAAGAGDPAPPPISEDVFNQLLGR